MTNTVQYNLGNTIQYATKKSFRWVKFAKSIEMIICQHQGVLRYNLVCWIQVLRNKNCLVFISQIGQVQNCFTRVEANK